MRAKSTVFMALAALLPATPLPAQEGHPLQGSWIGYWGPDANDRNYVTIVMAWDGREVTGVINPGTDSIPLKSVTLNPENWTVRMEVDATDRRGNPITYMIDGEILNLGLPSRRIRGVWTHGDARGDFEIERQ